MVASPEPNDDARYVGLALGGEKAAFRVLVERYQGKLLRLAMRLLGNVGDAEDAAQESFIKAFGALGRYDPARPFSSWLYRICINTCIDRRRKNRDLLEAGPEIAVDGHQTDNLERDDTARAVQAGLLRLDETYRIALVLKDVEELDYETMAEILGESIAALKIRVIRARQKLAKVLRKLHPDLVPPV